MTKFEFLLSATSERGILPNSTVDVVKVQWFAYEALPLAAHSLMLEEGTQRDAVEISWTERECRQLWNDTVRTGANDAIAGLICGSLVYIEKGLYQVPSQPPLVVIDGQHRSNDRGAHSKHSRGTWGTPSRLTQNR